MKTFIPFYDVKKYPHEVIVMDAHHPQGFDLSHWRGAPVPEGCEADTSTEIVLKAIEKDIPELNKSYVTNNHYDIDGFLGVWALFNPQLALKHKNLLIEIAQIADFREIDFKNSEWRKALKIVCLLNEEEARLFYPPFGAPEIAEKEMEACVPKYHYFLEAFTEMIQNEEKIKETEEYKCVIAQLEQNIQRKTISDIKMQLVEAKEPLHYYSLYAGSNHADMVMSLYSGNRYELEYKYTTWVTTTRKHFPRLNLQLLCDRLNRMENSKRTWKAEHFTDTAPILRLEGERLSKKERYSSPTARPIYPSSIAPELFKKECISYFREFYRDLSLGETLDWKELRRVNEEIFAKSSNVKI
ncbi:hypothetical protein JKA74_16340 [Marivirga sp. S37H4]|uniref:Uncharacterized protein n=1 Tax=Marivirga aurantiaca TaxID=2802615 RepID=A0A934X184_9BACT|nr:DUF6687 family protein [Marivirga aurantiaca]MBK6266616.1 hypothetical protein [Marivirga aurantiaca]